MINSGDKFHSKVQIGGTQTATQSVISSNSDNSYYTAHRCEQFADYVVKY